MAASKTEFLTPVGRLVAGSLYKPQDKDAEGKPLVYKHGPDAGKQRVDYFFAVAIQKGAEQHWAHTEWGAKIWAAGHAGFPNGAAGSPSFAWKIVDGDSQVPNKKGVKPCSREGYPGHWVISFGGGYAPRICNSDGSALITEPDAVKLGYYVQVYGTVAGNESPNQPGVFINHSAVSLQGYGKEIVLGMDPGSVGFGKGVALPAGASTVPVASAPAAAPGVPPVPGAPAAPVAAPPVPAVPGAPAAPAVPAGVAPHPGFLAGPGAAPAPAAPPAPAPAPAAPPAGPTMTAAATTTYDAYRAAGWSDDQLRANGLMV